MEVRGWLGAIAEGRRGGMCCDGMGSGAEREVGKDGTMHHKKREGGRKARRQGGRERSMAWEEEEEGR